MCCTEGAVQNSSVLYKSLVCPHLEFAMQCCFAHLQTVIEVIELEKIQRKVVKMLKGVEKLSYENRLRWQGLQSGEERLRGDMTEVFKSYKKKSPACGRNK